MIWYVAFGSAAGGATRYWLATTIQRMTGATFPVGTLLINITGSLVLGVLLRFALDTPEFRPELRVALTTGFCGGYTTFSTFSYETVGLIEAGEWRRAMLYVAASVTLSLAAAFLGVVLARELVALRHPA